MSGGSFDYLYSYLENNLSDSVSEAIRALESMSKWLQVEGEEEAARALWQYAQNLKGLYPPDELLPVVKAAEWWASHDIGQAGFREEWEKYKKISGLR